jgi:hypothetical protein
MRGSAGALDTTAGGGVAGEGEGDETIPPSNLANAGGNDWGSAVVEGGGGGVASFMAAPGIFKLDKLPFPMLLSVFNSKAASMAGGDTINIRENSTG